MTTPLVDTFEHDIANEIRNKEASIADIATAVGDIGNVEQDPPKNIPILISIGVIIFLCLIAGVVYILYSYYNPSTVQPQTTTTVKDTPEKQVAVSGMQAVSPTLDQNIGRFLHIAEKTKNGYIIDILSYSSVFSYMIKNESSFAEEIALALGITKTIQVVATTTPEVTQTSTTTTGTSTNKTKNSTSSQVVPAIIATPQTEYVFSDITISNQNMRIATTVYGTIVYAFIGTQNLLISTSPDGILALRANILHK